VSILEELTELTSAAFKTQNLEAKFGEVSVSQRPELCQFQCNGALAAAKPAGLNPKELAQTIADELGSSSIISEVDIAGPGFLNISVTDKFLAKKASEMFQAKDQGIPKAQSENIIIDYGGANVAKSLHVGHLRTALIGESLKRTYKLAGYKITGDVHLGDWGLPMGQLIAAIEDKFPELEYFKENSAGPFPSESPVSIKDLETLYPEASARCKTDEEFAEKARQATVKLQEKHPGYNALWQHFRDISVESLHKSYSSLGVEFELWLGEASVATRIDKMVENMKENGAAEESDGALIINVNKPEDKTEMPPLMLLNSRGGLTYGTTDLATIDERVQDFKADKIVYVVDNRQSLHFTQVFRAAKKSRLTKDNTVLIHASNGTVNGPDGKPLKTRDGNLPSLNDLVQESQELALKQLNDNNLAQDYEEQERKNIASQVGVAALAYGELSNHRTTNYNFDLDRFTQLRGQTGPYLQYVAVRAQSTLNKAAEQSFEPGELVEPQNDSERKLILTLLQMPEIIGRCIETNSPNVVAEFSYVLASAFNQFYDSCHILTQEKEAVRSSWLAVTQLTRKTLETLLNLLCIPIPNRM